jgi:hypothetical protein
MQNVSIHSMDRAGVVKELSVFQKTHGWWSDTAFINLQNQVLQEHIRKTLSMSVYAKTLMREGTDDEFQLLIDDIGEECPKMMIVFLNVFLDMMKSEENLQENVSRKILEWYRGHGYQFPRFKAEE